MRAWQLALGIAILLLMPLQLPGGSPDRTWRSGVVLSRKSVKVGNSFINRRFVYRIRSSDQYYLVIADTPLKLRVYVPMRFSKERGDLIVQDADGKERKLHILHTAPRTAWR